MDYPVIQLTEKQKTDILVMCQNAFCRIRVSDIETTSRIADGFENVPRWVAEGQVDQNELIGYLDAIDGTETTWGEWAIQAASILELELPEKESVLGLLKKRFGWALYGSASTYNTKWIKHYKELEEQKDLDFLKYRMLGEFNNLIRRPKLNERLFSDVWVFHDPKKNIN